MNGAHLHLIVNHVSLFSLVIGTLVLVTAMIRKSAELRGLASILFVVAGLFAWIAVETGEQAEDIVKKVAGDQVKSFIHEHEEAAAWAERSGILVAVLAVGMETAVRKKKSWTKPLQWTLLIFAIHGCTIFARTAYLGGFIQHTEIRS